MEKDKGDRLVKSLNEVIVEVDKELSDLPFPGSVAWEELVKARLALGEARHLIERSYLPNFPGASKYWQEAGKI